MYSLCEGESMISRKEPEFITERMALIRSIDSRKNAAIDIAVDTKIYLTDVLKLGHKYNGKTFCCKCYKEVDSDTRVHHCGGSDFVLIDMKELRDFQYEAAFTATDKFIGNEITMEEAVRRANAFNQVYNDNHGYVSLLDIAAGVGVSIEDALGLVMELIHLGKLRDDWGSFWYTGRYLALREQGRLQRVEWK